MFSQKIDSVISNAVKELNAFERQPVDAYTRDELIKLYWQYHPRFKSFKIYTPENSSILDIDAGNGGVFFWKEYLLPVKQNMKMTSLDLQKGEYFDRYENFALFNLDKGDMPFEKNSFDFIILSHLIEHVADWKGLVAKCEKVLKPNGFIYIETPSKHTTILPTRDEYIKKGFPCTTINFVDDHTHVETVDMEEVNTCGNLLGLITLEKGYVRNPLLENILLPYGQEYNDQEVSQYGLWAKLLWTSYIIFQKL